MTTTHMQTMERSETKLVGYTVTASVNQDLENDIVIKLREELFKKRHEIANRLDNDGIYLVQVYPDGEWTPDIPFISIVAVEVHDYSSIPEGFVQHTIPAGTYAKVTHKGPESQIGETYDFIRDQDICGSRPFDLEYWAQMDSLEEEESTIDIYLPMEE
ncbi:GyrI-like domain-containing protein [Paenibacillus sp. UMB4589-SE434]|uniref:GyrI-like domain-containing protein n=1 Tax=Paenibacillus sp. UMB4589-SE434 TaxID=3046314 RepID=UPI00254F7CA1|nr:GyrI-like domain-containing protein [Paenibacillus sp. UMB4589-SE434]MDK8181450.1 GyrI-like domain-containing protein [Paenibacillus sp. UMB4589-SE434]